MPPPPRFIEIANRLFVVTDIAGVVFEPTVVQRYARLDAKLTVPPEPRLESKLRVITQRGAETKGDGSYTDSEADMLLSRVAAELRTAGINHVSTLWAKFHSDVLLSVQPGRSVSCGAAG